MNIKFTELNFKELEKESFKKTKEAAQILAVNAYFKNEKEMFKAVKLLQSDNLHDVLYAVHLMYRRFK